MEKDFCTLLCHDKQLDTTSCDRHFSNSVLSTAKVFTKYLIDVTQFWIVHRLSLAWLVSCQDLSAGIAVPGLLRRDSSSVELAVHVFQDLEVAGCTFHKEAHQSYKHQPMNNIQIISCYLPQSNKTTKTSKVGPKGQNNLSIQVIQKQTMNKLMNSLYLTRLVLLTFWLRTFWFRITFWF